MSEASTPNGGDVASNDLEVGLVGASRIAVSAIIEPARTNSGVRVRGVAARDSARAAAYAADHGIGLAYASYAELLDDPKIDLVYIGTPPACHVDQALAAIARGKAVLVEKPFALDAAGARKVHDAALIAGLPVFEAMHSPHHALFARVLELLRTGAVGVVRHVDAVFDGPISHDDPFRWSRSLGGGALMDLGVYPLAWVRRILGDTFVVATSSCELAGDVDAAFSAELRFDCGATASVASSMAASEPRARLSIMGDHGRIDVMNPLVPQFGNRIRIEVDGARRDETVDGPTTYECQLEAVRSSIRERSPFPFPPDDYVRSMEAIDRVRASWVGGRDELAADRSERPQ